MGETNYQSSVSVARTKSGTIYAMTVSVYDDRVPFPL
jgi:hypothetical protein